MKRAFTCAVVLTVLAAVPTLTASQAKADFSGSWKSASSDDPPPPPPPPPPPRTLAMTITQTATALVIERTLSDQSAAVIQKVTYKLDGTESLNTNGVMTTRTHASWQGPQLVLSTIHSVEGNRIGDSTETYRLENGELIVERILNTPRGTISGSQIFVKGP
jgi:hypothetical protein